MKSRRISWDEWAGRSSLPVAVIDKDVDELVRACGGFNVIMDGFDNMNYVAYEYSGVRFLLARYFTRPGRGVDVYMYDGEYDGKILDGFLEDIGVGVNEVSWRL